MSLTVTVRDNETGEEQTARVADGDFVLIAADPCYLDSVQAYKPKGTAVLTVKGWRPQPEEAKP